MLGNPNRVAFYIDGYNLHGGIKESGLDRYLWLDLVKFARNLLQGNQHLVAVNYFTALIKRPRNKKDRQLAFLEANASSPDLTVYMGEFQYNPVRCSSCSSEFGCPTCGKGRSIPVEKQSDVSLGTKLGIDAALDHFDTAIIVSSDSDFVGAIGLIRHTFPEKRVVIGLPPGRYQRSDALVRAATAYYEIWPTSIAAAQLPNPVKLEDGRELWRPSAWT